VRQPLFAVAAVVGMLSAPSAAPQSALDAVLLAKVHDWTSAVMAHRQGQPDVPAATIAAWRESDVASVFAAVKCLSGELVRLEKSSDADPNLAIRQFPCGRAYSITEIRDALSLGDQGADAGGLDRLFARAALLHTDIALLQPSRRPVEDPADRPSALIVEDGRERGTLRLDTDFEWKCATSLSGLLPPAGANDFARRWYRSIIGYLEGRSQLGEATPLLDLALKAFPNDQVILFYAGAMHEVFAGPRTQSAVIAAMPPPDLEIGVKSVADELRNAEQFYRRATLAGPATAELVLHHARVVDGLGQHEQAIRELAQVAPALTDRDLQYDAALFLGQAHTALKQRPQAEARFNEALKLFPRAQSPLLGLSQVARQANDLPAAMAALERALMLPVSPLDRDDPWWRYDLSHVRNGDALLADLRKPFLQSEAK
jgi:tetratricopeptide (TPR) repeat protein